MTDVTARPRLNAPMAGDREFTPRPFSSIPVVIGNAGIDGANLGKSNYKIVGLLSLLSVKNFNRRLVVQAATNAWLVTMAIPQSDRSWSDSGSSVGISNERDGDGVLVRRWSGDVISLNLGKWNNEHWSRSALLFVTRTFDSNGFTFLGSAWDAASVLRLRRASHS